ncbi:MAG: hypothetical protein U1D25_18900 [Hydrogenophaga sp.]|jgi:hypothetical protein|uniref:hypothetical protein n=1 Tax=Hydrogenophaga sp. TaxID=1904254 RepID=UPI00272F943F|nr:hypothetical protein [Hydrogenophaga sp.]MDP2408082.1 hypothetical protein [Hydrogenophaga sp.]MDZ4190155.1 hypothetical protein [Hydrogenophaga sp.]
MAVEKQLLQAVAAVMFLDPLRESRQLDEVGNGHLIEAEEVLLSQPPRVVIAAFATWNRTGRRLSDPRPVKVTFTGELASRDRGHRGQAPRPAAVFGGYRGAKD